MTAIVIKMLTGAFAKKLFLALARKYVEDTETKQDDKWFKVVEEVLD